MEELARYFGLAGLPDREPRYNLAPGHKIPVVRWAANQGRRLDDLVWGLVPGWAGNPEDGPRPINARIESITQKPFFRSAAKTRRALIAADGYYEWAKGPGKTKQPWFFRPKDGSPMALAGLWERWTDPLTGESLETTLILTGPANETAAPIHDRMPVILDPRHFEAWLDPRTTDFEDLRPLCRPPAADVLCAWPVAPLVNSARYEGPDLIEPFGPVQNRLL
jgi:putative SOS response-associated peptidase YedK